ncbi:hypothetical protein G6F56_010503 [Rhizopus delemar]|nr:hypothetical protein G6F56_010503 [Rhizopus delemar]
MILIFSLSVASLGVGGVVAGGLIGLAAGKLYSNHESHKEANSYQKGYNYSSVHNQQRHDEQGFGHGGFDHRCQQNDFGRHGNQGGFSGHGEQGRHEEQGGFGGRGEHGEHAGPGRHGGPGGHGQHHGF